MSKIMGKSKNVWGMVASLSFVLGMAEAEPVWFAGRYFTCLLGSTDSQMRKRVWVYEGDLVLVEIRDDKADLVFKYLADEARRLKQIGQIPQSTQIGDASETTFEPFEFTSESSANCANPKPQYDTMFPPSESSEEESGS